jgi:hypothetical protein
MLTRHYLYSPNLQASKIFKISFEKLLIMHSMDALADNTEEGRTTLR